MPFADPRSKHEMALTGEIFWIRAPFTAQRTASEKDCRPAAGAIVDRKSLDVKDNCFQVTFVHHGSSSLGESQKGEGERDERPFRLLAQVNKRPRFFRGAGRR